MIDLSTSYQRQQIADTPARFSCTGCGESALSRDVTWVEHYERQHTCPTPEEINRALRGEYDG